MCLRGFPTFIVVLLSVVPSVLSSADDSDDLFRVDGSFSRLVPEFSILAGPEGDRIGLDSSSQGGEAAGAQDPRVEFSAGAGVHFGGEFTFDVAGWGTYDMDMDGDLLAKASLDFFPIPYLGLGLFGSYGITHFEDTGELDIDLLDVGASVKARLPILHLIYITPAVGIGYRGIIFDTFDDRVDGLAINFGVDFRIRLAFLEIWVEPGFLSQPYGEIEDDEVTFGPIPYIMGGLALTF